MYKLKICEQCKNKDHVDKNSYIGLCYWNSYITELDSVSTIYCTGILTNDGNPIVTDPCITSCSDINKWEDRLNKILHRQISP